MPTSDLIQQEHAIVQYYFTSLKEWEEKKKQAKDTIEKQKKDTLNTQEEQKKGALAALNKVREVRDMMLTNIEIHREILQKHGKPYELAPMPGLLYEQKMSAYLHIEEQLKDSIVAFVEAKGSIQAKITRFADILSCIVILLISILISFSASILNNLTFGVWALLIGILLALITYFIVKQAILAKPRNDYKTMELCISVAEDTYNKQLQAIEISTQQRMNEIDAEKSRIDHQIEQWWQGRLTDLRQQCSNFSNTACDNGLIGTDWSNQLWRTWQPSMSALPLTRLGTFAFDPIYALPSIPALVACPGGGNILIQAAGAAKQIAIATIQSVMLRLLATQPAGKVRFTLIDPVGLGQNVATFMQLTDHDEALVSSRAWTEPRHIEKQLENLTEHMENVIQKYLRGQYNTIEEYNEQAGEVAEPYRVLVVVGFPNNFNEETARRLLNIATNGPRCGLSTMVIVDSEVPLPHGFNSGDLKRVSNVINWNRENFVWDDPDYSALQLLLDTPPVLDQSNYILQEIGKAAKNANRIEVPFSKIAPLDKKDWWWAGKAQEGLSVPLGPAGANKYQRLELGHGTAQHVLVVGKTGSGKTNLLHVIITCLCLIYSPDELELYLVDFKTVGFTAYATHRLPHARVVAIQSEREFGLSVLKGLDTEMERRKNLFSRNGVQDIAQYRSSLPHERQPRILLLVDEFQEFFTYDDDIAQQAALLLDRLVRQGRAFGMHVMLGSQTLSGAYTLARSTISQMAIRIALQCEEADSRLVLSDENPAARLLTRSGEAIYNAANGLVEGNNPFQGFRLAEEELVVYLTQIQQFAQQRRYDPPWKQIVFDGNKNALVVDNSLLADALAASSPLQTQKGVATWLGDPIAIKEPTAAYIRTQAGSNLLIVGQQDEAAQGMFITALLSVVAQHPTGSAYIFLCDLMSSSESTNAGLLERLGQSLSPVVQVANRRNLTATVARICAEVERRMEVNPSSAPSIYLFILGLQRARDLRPVEEFGFSSFGTDDATAQPNHARQFSTILREGPELKVHTLAWCDTLTNLNRTLERGSLREFEMRVAFQMSTEDSMNLIDSPAASNLGPYRTILFSEETGRIEKFRPYGIPQEPDERRIWGQWMQKAIQQINQKQQMQSAG
jgi:S-DNA-T family DNA segregation ATPase FtsK/SpoIIIE